MFFIKLKSFIRDYFTLTSRERKGAIVLVVIITFQIFAIIWLHYLSPPFEPILITHKLQLDAFDARIAEAKSFQSSVSRKENNVDTLHKLKPVFTEFDPNQITNAQWMAMGFSEKQVSVIRNYLDKGGRFRNKESVSKMYCISPEQFKLMEPWIVIPEKETFKNKSFVQTTFPKKKTPHVELNSADTIQLAELPLIGPGRARMIFKYRERLGGFVSINQLLEVFTMDSTVFQAILPYIVLDVGKIRKLNLNSDSLYHPYLNKRVASALVAYRKQHGNFIDINDLRKVAVLDEQMWRKVAPYATFE